jgi:tetratricopeptide (TPR) repeat protein
LGIDRGKVLQNAQLFASKGQFTAAINEWKKLAAESPGDGSIHNSIGELHLKRNATGDAVISFLQAANAFRAEGATLKAIATFKKVLKLDPGRYEIYRHLGDLNAERGLLSSAVQDYLTLGKHYLKEGRTKDALDVYKKIVSQDPSNLDAQQRVAELCVQENMQDEATKVYLQLGRERSAQQRYSEAKEAYQSVLRIDPTNSEALQFIEHYEKTGSGTAPSLKTGPNTINTTRKAYDPMDLLAEASRRIDDNQHAGAEAILNQLLSKEPGNPQVCRLFARLHLRQGQFQMALGEYRFLAGAALRAQEFAQAESLITEFLAVEPNSVPMLELHGQLYEEQGDAQNAALWYGKAVEALLEHPEPGLPTLHEEIFEKIKAMAPGSAIVTRLAALMGKGGETEASACPAAIERAAIPPSIGESAEQVSAQVDGIDLETHYTLGVAFKNMGLLEQAKEEFMIAMRSPVVFADACLMMAICLKEQGQDAAATAQLESLLSDQRCHGTKGQVIRYELGLLYEKQARWQEAVRMFESIPTFHDVPQRLAAIRAEHTCPPPESLVLRQAS